MNKSTQNALMVAVLGAAAVYVLQPVLKPLRKAVGNAFKGGSA